ncbi:hypothetical protein [Streptomyces sp. NPDC049949]|uniref:hypothetical protein n=1 Tax=Streptomyces sp. NPDC049949 TaxID=3154627 RepID=UPI00342280CE
MASLGLWVARRSHGVGEAGIAVGYARAQAPTAYGLVFVFVFVVETVGVSFMLAAYPVAHLVMRLLDLYTVLLVLGLHAAAVTRPHVVGPGELRVRRGARLDLRIPLERIVTAIKKLLPAESSRVDVEEPKDMVRRGYDATSEH